MRLRSKRDAARDVPAADLFALCEQLYGANSGLVRTDQVSCAAFILNLVSPDGGETYELAVHNDPERSYGIFPLGKYAGHGSFIDPDGGFLRHGRITRADAEWIVTTFIPAAPAETAG